MSKRAHAAEESKRKQLARQRLRGLIRSAIFNRIWLSDVGEQKLSLNVKKNIAMLVRAQRKIGMLTLAEKTLLRTHPAQRTIEDRKKLAILLASLICFNKIPPKVRARLVPFVRFMYLGAGRVLIKEGNQPMTAYFVLTGEIEISSRVFDPMKNDYIEKAEFIAGPGDVLGELELIENIPRINTCRVTSDAELLEVFDDDFNIVLRPVMAKMWFEKKTAITTLGYFNSFTNDQIIKACKLGILRQFEPLESIYFKDKGQMSYVHFIVSGECMILQCLKMKVTETPAGPTFELVDISKDDSSAMFQDISNKEFLLKMKEEHKATNTQTYDIDQEIASIGNEDDKKTITLRNMDIKSIEISCGMRKPSGASLSPGHSTAFSNEIDVYDESMHYGFSENEEGTEGTEGEAEYEEEEEGDQVKDVLEASAENAAKHTVTKNYQAESVVKNAEPAQEKQERKRTRHMVKTEPTAVERQNELRRSIFRGTQNEEKVENAAVGASDNVQEYEEYTEGGEEEGSWVSEYQYSKTSSFVRMERKKERTKVENHFIDVGSLTYGGIFGLGEKLEHRVIMARTTVQCLMLPRFWLFQRDQNPGNVWQRRRFYLDTTIPPRLTLFKDFLSTRRWQKFKKDFIESNLDPVSTNNQTKVQDIPIICRIVEAHAD